MGKSFWDIFCEEDGNSSVQVVDMVMSSADFLDILNPFSCVNHAFIIFLAAVIIGITTYMHFRKLSSWRMNTILHRSHLSSTLSLSSSIFNGILGLVYLGTGVWLFAEKLFQKKTVLPLHKWLVLLFQGLSWLMLMSALTFMRCQISKSIAAKMCFVLALLFATFLWIPSLWMAVVDREVSVRTVLDILLFPGSIFLIWSTFHEQNGTVASLCEPLQAAEAEYDHVSDDQAEIHDEKNLPPFARAGLFSMLTFWWLNPLMNKGRKKHLEDDDIPMLRIADRANTCYSEFMEQLLQKPEAKDSSHTHSHLILSTLFSWQWKSILVAGFFALIKILATSTCTIFLRLFIKVAEEEETFEYEGYALTAGLFLVKCLESFSERQWYFRMRLVGTQVRSMLSASIYKKQLKASPSAKFTSGEIVSLVSVDAYRLGEFPYWLHQIWTTPLQLCLSLLIIYYCIGLGTLATLIVFILTLFGSLPQAKLQTKCQMKFMEEQDKMVQFISASLSTVKVLKLYAWEMHFKKTAERLREEEYVGKTSHFRVGRMEIWTN